jgi:hypothetical protein
MMSIAFFRIKLLSLLMSLTIASEIALAIVEFIILAMDVKQIAI